MLARLKLTIVYFLFYIWTYYDISETVKSIYAAYV